MGGRVEILQGDCRTVLLTLEAQSVQCCVTSPPYWGLRDYGTAEWEGGDAECGHVDDAYEGTRVSNSPKQLTSNGSYSLQYKNQCSKCGARRIDSQLGLEATSKEYIEKMVAVFREVWRVLKDDGTLWLNMGDTFSGKQLQGIPWRMAFALQADGWYLRSDIIWAKPNPMPESVTDRPTKSHEYIFLLSKQERYFYDADAIKEPSIDDVGKSRGGSLSRSVLVDRSMDAFVSYTNHRGPSFVSNGFRNKRTVWTVATQPYVEAHFATFPEDLIKPCILAGSRVGDTVLDPFAGSGTTGKVALELGRAAIGIELNHAYVAMAHARTNVTAGFF